MNKISKNKKMVSAEKTKWPVALPTRPTRCNEQEYAKDVLKKKNALPGHRFTLPLFLQTVRR